MDYATKLAKHAEKYRGILSADPYLPLQSTFVTSLERTHEYADHLIKSQVDNLTGFWPWNNDNHGYNYEISVLFIPNVWR